MIIMKTIVNISISIILDYEKSKIFVIVLKTIKCLRKIITKFTQKTVSITNYVCNERV